MTEPAERDFLLKRLLSRVLAAPPTSFTGHDLKLAWACGCMGLRAVARIRANPNAEQWLPLLVHWLTSNPDGVNPAAIEAHCRTLQIRYSRLNSAISETTRRSRG